MSNSILATALILSALVTMGLSFDQAFAASFAKYDGVDGESTDSGVNDTENEGTFVLQPPMEASASSQDVPPWIKTSMTYWVEGHTSDAEFLNAVEYLASEKIIRVSEPTSTGDFDTEMVSLDAQKSTSTSSFDTEMISMNAERADSFFDIFYESYTVDSFFDIWTELQESTDSFFDVFFEVDTPRTNECLRGQELVFDKRSSSWQCASANTVDSFFDVFFDVATESSQNTEDIAELERKVSELERKIAELENGSTSGNVETEFKVEKGE
jgi:hypothetical protein